MVEDFTIQAARESDVSGIASVLLANRGDPSLFLRSEADVRRNLDDFMVAKVAGGQVVGCAAVHAYSATLAEVLSVAVLQGFQGRGVGARLMNQCLQEAVSRGLGRLWLATAKPGYFARYGFETISRWSLPTSVLLAKLRQVFQQPPGIWLPALSGRFTFMARKCEP